MERLISSLKNRKGAICLLLCGLITLMPGCRSDREDRGWQQQDFATDGYTDDATRDSVDFILQKVLQQNPRFSTFSANLDIKVSADQTQIGLSGQLRISKDRIIWLNLSKLFFELGRAKMTPDSLSFYSKIGNTASLYLDDTAVSVLPSVFRLSQCLFLRQADTSMLEGKRRLLRSDSAYWVIEGSASDSIVWNLIIGRHDFKIAGMSLQVTQNRSSLQARLHYLQENEFEITLSADRQTMVQARILYAKVRWDNAQSYPFAFPSSVPLKINHGLLQSIENIHSSPEEQSGETSPDF